MLTQKAIQKNNRKVSTSGGNEASGRLRLHERKALSRREALFRPARARHFRDNLGTDSVRYKLPPPCVPVSPSPVSREASRDLWRAIRPSTMGVFKLRTSVQAHSLSPKISLTSNVHIHFKTNFIFTTLETRRDSSDGGSVERGSRTDAELHTSGPKRA